jgi:hypothetical protein
MIKALKKLGVEGSYLNVIKDKPIVNIILHGGKPKTFPQKSGMTQRCLLLPLLLNTMLENLARAIRQEKETK